MLPVFIWVLGRPCTLYPTIFARKRTWWLYTRAQCIVKLLAELWLREGATHAAELTHAPHMHSEKLLRLVRP